MPFWLTITLMGAAAAQQTPPAQPLPPDEDKPATQSKQGAKPAESDLPPDEDAPTVKEDYSFNPVKSKRSITAGDYYFHKGNFKAAAERFRDATKWNEGNADAWLKLGEAEEKREQPRAAREAYQRYLQLAGNTKSAVEVKKRLERLEKDTQR